MLKHHFKHCLNDYSSYILMINLTYYIKAFNILKYPLWYPLIDWLTANRDTQCTVFI